MIVLHLILFIFLVALLSSIIFFYKRKSAYNLNGPIPLPFIGNLLIAVFLKANAMIPLLQYFEEKYGDAYIIFLFHTPYIILSHPKEVEGVLSNIKYIQKGKSYKYLRPWLGDGLLTSKGQKWKNHRRFLTPAFHFNILQNFLPVFLKNEKILIKKLEALADGTAVNVFPILALYALDNVTESIMGVSVHAQEHSESEYVKSIETLSTIIAMRMRNPIIALDFVFNLTKYKKIQDRAIKVLHNQSYKVIESRRAELKDQNISGNENSELGIKNKHAFLDLLLLSEIDGKKIDNEQIREEVDTFMFEGHDTTTSAIAYILHCVSKRQDVQKKILEELKQILGDDMTSDPTYANLKEMKYLESVIKEGLRLFPSVPLIERMITEDSEISGMRVLKNTSIIINLFDLQRHPDLFEDPLEFRPERFAGSNSTSTAFNWLAFSAGPRNCIGQKFAMMEMKITLCGIIKNFKLLPVDEEHTLIADLILRSEHGVKVSFIKRN